MLQVVPPEPEEKEPKANAFQDIHEVPWWRWWLEVAGYAATLIVIAEFLMKVLQ